MWRGFHLWVLASDIAILWAEVDALLGSDRVVAEVEPDRLNDKERLLVLLVVDGVSFVISCCKASNGKG